jgi:class 3 adenylate cyclase/HAMP domain-containing protein
VRLRPKLTIAFFVLSSLISVLLALFLYRFIEDQLERDLRARLRAMASIGAAEVEIAPYGRLVQKLGTLDPKSPTYAASIDAIEKGVDYGELSSHLRMIRKAEPDLVHYAYLLAPTDDADHPKFVADADVLELVKKQENGEPLPKGEDGEPAISHFDQPYDVSTVPLLKKALVDCTPQYEPAFVYDKSFAAWSVSAYIPITDDDGKVMRDARGRCLGVLGVDITDTDMRAALDHAGGLAIKISLAVIALALVVSIGMGTVLTRALHALAVTVRRFADKDFAARTSVRSKDEVGQLGQNFNQMAATIQLHNEHLEDLVKQRTKELLAEKQTSERLLLNVLPAPIADRLKSGAEIIVDRFDAVSVLFADIVGFTSLSAHTTPEKLVTMLDELFSAFDKLAEKHGLEKIKTIGDAYMVVAGVPQPIADHAIAITHMALDMQASIAAYAARTDTQLTIRIGIHTGPVVAGVIGKKKFIYDLWGDTVNTASRMESHGVPGRVHVTTAMVELVKNVFDVETRGPIEVKGKGMMTTFLVVGLKPPKVTIEERQSGQSAKWSTDDGG